jgi:inorganic phosphate transporter, PiT family
VLFSRGIVSAPPSVSFAVAVLAGSSAWVGIATATSLPVSTTHAIVGALIGAGIQLAPGAVNWGVLLTNVAGPLLASIGVAYATSAALPLLTVTSSGLTGSRSQSVGGPRFTLTTAHWLTSGATGLARGLNGTPKIVAIGAFALVPNRSDASWLVGAVAVALAIGSLVAGMRVARSLGEKVVRMDHMSAVVWKGVVK